MQMNDWKNKTVALVTGANKGIGLQIARDLATHGFTVLVGSRNLDHGETASKSVGADARVVSQKPESDKVGKLKTLIWLSHVCSLSIQVAALSA